MISAEGFPGHVVDASAQLSVVENGPGSRQIWTPRSVGRQFMPRLRTEAADLVVDAHLKLMTSTDPSDRRETTRPHESGRIFDPVGVVGPTISRLDAEGAIRAIDILAAAPRVEPTVRPSQTLVRTRVRSGLTVIARPRLRTILRYVRTLNYHLLRDLPAGEKTGECTTLFRGGRAARDWQ